MAIRPNDQLLESLLGLTRVSERSRVGVDRSSLGFDLAVRKAFDFMATFGFRETNATPTSLGYCRHDVRASIWHGRRSFEIGFHIGQRGEQYSISELVRGADIEQAKRYRNYVAMTPVEVVNGVEKLAELVRKFAPPALNGDKEFFALLRRQRESWAQGFALDVLERQIRPKAAEAFRTHRYADAAELFEEIMPRLTPAEQVKLDLARRRANANQDE